jgi:hypothetical protein
MVAGVPCKRCRSGFDSCHLHSTGCRVRVSAPGLGPGRWGSSPCFPTMGLQLRGISAPPKPGEGRIVTCGTHPRGRRSMAGPQPSRLMIPVRPRSSAPSVASSTGRAAGSYPEGSEFDPRAAHHAGVVERYTQQPQKLPGRKAHAGSAPAARTHCRVI